ncbi:hypothetical protein [Sphingomonas sp. RB1R13]|uniref:hypothetical protein n=1 Tax=Sphingomonas sp. RB1R13 TaxID=3096159 RepID=UPI002FCCB13E
MSISVAIPEIKNSPVLNRDVASIVGNPALARVLIYKNALIELVTEFARPKVSPNPGVRNIGSTRARHAATLHATQPFQPYVNENHFVAECTLSHRVNTVIADDLDKLSTDVVAVSVDKPDGRPFAARAQRMSDAAAFFGPRSLATSAASGIHRDTYLSVFQGSTFHRYSNDEYLNRRIFFAARRIGASEVTFHCHLAPRRWSCQEKALGILTYAQLTALAGGVAQGSDKVRICGSRNQLAQSVAFPAVATKYPSALAVFRQAVSEARPLPIAWQCFYLRYRAVFVAARLVLALRQ